MTNDEGEDWSGLAPSYWTKSSVQKKSRTVYVNSKHELHVMYVINKLEFIFCSMPIKVSCMFLINVSLNYACTPCLPFLRVIKSKLY